MTTSFLYPHQRQRPPDVPSSSKTALNSTFHDSVIQPVIQAGSLKHVLNDGIGREAVFIDMQSISREYDDAIDVEAALLKMHDAEDNASRKQSTLIGGAAAKSGRGSVFLSPVKDPRKKRKPSTPSRKGESPAILPFIQQLSSIVGNAEYQNAVSWSSDGRAIIIHDIPDFEASILPKHFNHCNYWSFARQLTYYGLRSSNVIYTQVSSAVDKISPPSSTDSIRIPASLNAASLSKGPPSSPPSRNAKSVPPTSAFQHPSFIRGRRETLHRIRRTGRRNDEEEASNAVARPLPRESMSPTPVSTTFQMWTDTWTPVFGPCIASSNNITNQMISTRTGLVNRSPLRAISPDEPFTALYSDEAELFPLVSFQGEERDTTKKEARKNADVPVKPVRPRKAVLNTTDIAFESVLNDLRALKESIDRLPARSSRWLHVAQHFRSIASIITEKGQEAEESMGDDAQDIPVVALAQ